MRKKKEKENKKKTKCEKKVQNIIFQAGLGIIDYFVLPCRNINTWNRSCLLLRVVGFHRFLTDFAIYSDFTVCNQQGMRWQMFIDANTFTGSSKSTKC